MVEESSVFDELTLVIAMLSDLQGPMVPRGGHVHPVSEETES